MLSMTDLLLERLSRQSLLRPVEILVKQRMDVSTGAGPLTLVSVTAYRRELGWLIRKIKSLALEDAKVCSKYLNIITTLSGKF